MLSRANIMCGFSSRLIAVGPVIAVLLTLPASIEAKTISLNFARNDIPAWIDESFMLPADEAGAPGARAANWNNLEMGNREGAPEMPDNVGSFAELKYHDGTNSGAWVDWSTDLSDEILNIYPTDDGDKRMWKGYLDAQDAGAVTVGGLSYAAPYDVYVYFDGGNGKEERAAQFRIGSIVQMGVDIPGADFHNTPSNDFEYRLVDPMTNIGNYVVFSGVIGDSFTLEAMGLTGQYRRAAIQGIQIVGSLVPEPSTWWLTFSAIVGLVTFARRAR